MQSVYSNGKALGGIYRAVVIETSESADILGDGSKNARLYIPALHREEMPFKLSSDGTIQGCIFETLTQVATETQTQSTSPEDPEEVETNTTVETTSDTETATLPTPTATPEPSPAPSTPTGDTTSSTEADTETEEEEENSTSSEGTVTVPTIHMKKEDFPVAQISGWEVCQQLKTGSQVWVIFENGDVDFPIVVGSLGSILPMASAFAGTGMGGTGTMSLDSNDAFIELVMSIIWEQEASGENTGLHISSPLTDPFTLGRIGFAKTAAVEVLKRAFNAMDEERREELDPGGELYNWVFNIADTLDYDTNSVWWSANLKFRDRVNAVVTSEEGNKAQEEYAKELVKGYVSKITGKGITDPGVVIYLSDILNQYGENYIRASQYTQIQNKSLDDVHTWWTSQESQYKSRRDKVYAKVKELEESGQLAQFQSYGTSSGALSSNRGGQMTIQQFLDTYNRVNGTYTDQPPQDFGGVASTECPELPRYYMYMCFGIPRESTEGIGNGIDIAINVCSWDVTKNHFQAADPSAGVMPGDIVSLTSNTPKGRIYGHTGVVKSVQSNGDFQIIDQWAGASYMAITDISKSRLVAIARPK